MPNGSCGTLDYMRCKDNQYVCVPSGYPTKTIACNQPDLYQSCNGPAGKCGDTTATEWTKQQIKEFKEDLETTPLKYIKSNEVKKSLGEYIDNNNNYKEKIFNCIIKKCGNMTFDEAIINIFESLDYTSIINTCLSEARDNQDDEEKDEEKDEENDEENDEEKDNERILTIKKKLGELQQTDSTYFLELQNNCKDVDILGSIEKNITDSEYKQIKDGNKQELKNITDKLLEMCIKDNTNVEETIDPSFIKKDNKLSLLALIFIIIGVIIFIIACILFIKRSKKQSRNINSKK